MPRKIKRPTIKRFREVCHACGGNLSKVADTLGVSRRALYYWGDEDPEYMEVLQEFRERTLDECVVTSRILALGIPDVDPVTKKVKGWKERPDGQMLRYLMGVYGRKEGYGEAIDITSNGQTLPSAFAIEVIDRREQIQQAQEDDTEVE